MGKQLYRLPTNNSNLFHFLEPFVSFFPSVSLREGHSFLCLPKEKKQKKGQPRR
jgi:hypothetical protein